MLQKHKTNVNNWSCIEVLASQFWEWPVSLSLSVSGINADSLAVDWVARNLYWADSVNSQINAVGLDGDATRTTDRVVILGEDLGQLRSIALLPQEGFELSLSSLK